MEELIQALRQTLANTFGMYFQAHSGHWNVEGPDFAEYHDFLGELYEELHGAVDPIAEYIRILDAYAPGDISEMMMSTSISAMGIKSNPRDIISSLVDSNNICLLTLMTAFKASEAAGEVGLSDFLTQRINAHQKHAWQMRSMLK
jgi:starvation-inducible DNA-binding protein